MFRSRSRLSKAYQEIDNKISVLEDICDRADMRISKLKHEIGQIEISTQQQQEAHAQQKQEISLPTYQAVVERIQMGKSTAEISSEMGLPLEEVEVLNRLIQVSLSSQT